MRKSIRVHGLIAGLILATAARAETEARTAAILGDSLGTGAGTHPAMTYDSDTLWDILKGVVPIKPDGNAGAVREYLGNVSMSPPNYLWYSNREFNGGIDWVYKHLLKRLSYEYLNTEEYSWGYLTARKSGITPSHIFLASENGARISAISRQADRVLDRLKGRLPHQIYILFSGNDLCAHHIKLVTPADTYKNQLVSGLRYLVRNGTPTREGTEIVLAGFLGVTQLLVNESIMEKKITAFGKQMTCRQLRARNYQPDRISRLEDVRNPEAVYFNNLIPPNPGNYCPTLFSLSSLARNDVGLFSGAGEVQNTRATSGDQKENQSSRQNKMDDKVSELISILASRIRQYRVASVEAIRETRAWAHNTFPKKNIKFSYVYETENLNFGADDVGEDCFHLSLNGHIKISKALIKRNPGQVDLLKKPSMQ